MPDLVDPGWQRLLRAARRKLERTGGELAGEIGLTDPSDPERRVVIGITGQYRRAQVRRLSVSLSDVDNAIRTEHGIGLLAALARLDGPIRDRQAERAGEEATRSAMVADARRRYGGGPWFVDWLDGLRSDGTLTRLIRRGETDLLGWAAEVLRRLPAAGIPLPVLAEWATGDTKALSGTSLATLVLRAVAAEDGVPAPTDAAERRARWEAHGVVLDDLASQVLVLGLRVAEDHLVATWLNDAAAFGIPFRLTLHQLIGDPVTPVARDIFVCENPAVLRMAAAELDDNCAPLICTEGQPSTACRRLLAPAGGRIHWRGDFDWTGLRTTTDAIRRYGAVPWRMSGADYAEALDRGDSEALKGSPASSPWDLDLAERMAQSGRAVMEERLIPRLLDDLRLDR